MTPFQPGKNAWKILIFFPGWNLTAQRNVSNVPFVKYIFKGLIYIIKLYTVRELSCLVSKLDFVKLNNGKVVSNGSSEKSENNLHKILKNSNWELLEIKWTIYWISVYLLFEFSAVQFPFGFCGISVHLLLRSCTDDNGCICRHNLPFRKLNSRCHYT